MSDCHVLLVEDDDDTRDLMLRLLTRQGCDVSAARTVAEALGHLEETSPTHILLDLMLPDAGGALLLRAVRKRNLDVRVALVTAAGKESRAVVDAERWEPDAVFHKPIDFQQVQSWLSA